MKYMKNKYSDENGNIVSFWSTDDNVLCEDGKTLRENLDEVDTQFKDSINTKADKATTENLQTQVNNLVLGAVGDGNNAEVVQARGNYPVLNNRLDEYLNYVKGLIKNSMNLILNTSEIPWNLGSVGTDGATNTSNNTRIHSDMIRVKKGSYVSINDTSKYKFRIAKYRGCQEASYIDDGVNSMTTVNPKVVDEDCYIRIVMAKNDNSSISDAGELAQNLNIGLVLEDKYIEKENVLDILASDMEIKNNLFSKNFVVKNEYYSATNQAFLPASNNTINCHSDKIIVSAGVKYVRRNAIQDLSSIAFFDENTKFISCVESSVSVKDTITAPDSAKYMVVSLAESEIENFGIFIASQNNSKKFMYELNSLKINSLREGFMYEDLCNELVGKSNITLNSSKILKYYNSALTSSMRIFEKQFNVAYGEVVQFDIVGAVDNVLDFSNKGCGVFVEWLDLDNNKIYQSNKYNSYITSNELRQHRFRYPVPQGVKKCNIVVFVRGTTTLSISNFAVRSVTNIPKKLLNYGINYCAHLGFISYAPRNTMPAFELANIAGFNSCVTNANITKDGVLVALHNDTIDATSNGTGSIHNMTYEEVSQYDFGGWFNDVYKNTKIPKLEEVLRYMAQTNMHPYIRLNDSFTTAEIYQKIYDICKKYNLLGNVTLKAFSLSLLDEAYKTFGDKARYEYCGYEDINSVCSHMKNSYGNAEVIIDLEQANKDFQKNVNIVLSNGIRCSCWTVNDMGIINDCIKLGVTEFCTDVACDPIFR